MAWCYQPISHFAWTNVDPDLVIGTHWVDKHKNSSKRQQIVVLVDSHYTPHFPICVIQYLSGTDKLSDWLRNGDYHRLQRTCHHVVILLQCFTRRPRVFYQICLMVTFKFHDKASFVSILIHLQVKYSGLEKAVNYCCQLHARFI